MPNIDTNDTDAVWAYIKGLPPLLRGTAGGNTPCVEIQAGGETLIIEAGTGIRRLGLELMKGPCGRGEGKLHIFLSHVHWDHIQGFPFFVPAYVPGNQLIFYGIHDLETALSGQQRYLYFPVSLDAKQAEQELRQLDEIQRQRYGPIPFMPAQREYVRLEAGVPFSVGPVSINTIHNRHPGDAISYRFEDQYSTFVYASDAEYKNLDDESIQARLDFFKDADALLFDAQYGLRESWEAKQDWGHSSAMIGVDFARRSGVKKLLLSHHEPTYSDVQLQEIEAIAIDYQAQDDTLPACEVLLVYEGLTLDLTPMGAIESQLGPEGETAVLTASRTFDAVSIDYLIRHPADQDPPRGAAESVLDLSQVERLSTATLKKLVTFSQQRKAGPLVLAAPSHAVEEVIRLGGYADYFAIYPTVEEAVKAVEAREALNLSGQMINVQYQITKTLGQGLLGTVLEVIDRERNRHAALRILSPTFGVETLDNFASQVHHLLDLEHGNIARIYDCDWSQDGNHTFVVEELLVGPTLYERLKDYHDPMATDEALDLALDLTLALEYAHSRGVVHGNLKPQDVFLTEDGAKISGFGLGRLEEGRNLLEAPVVFLEASHLAPEQILGQPLDARSDLYALGVILYQLFTGRLPFEGSQQEVLRAHLEQDPLPLRDLNPNLSLSVEHLILKLLAKNPNDRYASAQQARRISSNLIFSAGDVGQPGQRFLVGRDHQLQTLKDCWTQVRAGQGQLAFVTGEPGIGKTSLVEQLAAQSGAAVVLMGRCYREEGRPYHPFAEALQAYFATVPPELSDQEAQRLMSDFSRLVPDLSQIIPHLPQPRPLEPEQEQLRLISNLTQFIKQATQRRPWLLILDDLHWIDERSIELLRYLGRRLPETALLMVGTYNDTEVGRDHPLQIALRDLSRTLTYQHVPLDRLSREDVERVLGNLWNPSVPDSLVEKIYQQTEGNPLYVEEVAKGLEDDGLVSVQEGRWRFPQVETIRLPQSMYEAVEGRIHYLSADTRDVLSQAAVFGQTFGFGNLVAMTTLPEWTVLEHLDLALERQLVQEVGGDDMLRFTHGEIYQVIYGDLGALRRRRLHRRAGETIEERAQPKPERFAEELAHHFQEAGELERALIYAIHAANQAKAAYANETTVTWHARTLDLLSRLDPEESASFEGLRVSVHQSMGGVLTLLGKYDEALVCYASARNFLEAKSLASEQARQLAELCYRTAEVYELRSEYDVAFEWLHLGLGYLKRDRPSIEVAHIYNQGALLHRRQGNYDQAIEWCQKSLDAAAGIKTADGERATARGYNTLAVIYRRRGDLAQALEYCRQSVRLYQELDDIAGLSQVNIVLSNVHADQGDWDQAGEALRQSLVLKQQIGDIVGQGMIANNLGYMHLNRGELDQAAKLFEQSYGIWEQVGSAWGEGSTLINLAQVWTYLENWAEARTCLTRSQSLLAEIGSEEFLPELERSWGKYYLARAARKVSEPGELGLALDHTQRSIELAVTLGDRLEEGKSYRTLGRVHQAQDDPESAQVALRRSLKILSELDSEYETAITSMVLATLALESNPAAVDRAQLEQAIRTFEKLGAQVHLAKARRLVQRYDIMDL
jgi:phosphoribosyl 1,2-cyclic phosphodiesterase/tetratricopeptide (TPR) repeat protein